LYAGELSNLIQQTGWVARAVLAILFFFSLFSWALIFQKLSLFGRLRRRTNRFLQAFRATRGLPEPRAVGSTGSPLETIYAAGYRELASQLMASNPHPRVKSVHAVTADMQVAAAEEVRKMERFMPWLATTGSVTPFIGLFGTVWGIIDAFHGLGTSGAATLRAVAPGISEALITTAAGLLAAIPAVIFYNQFNNSIREFGARMDDFTLEMLNAVERSAPVAQSMAVERR